MVVYRTILQLLQAQLVPALTQVSDGQAVFSMTGVVCSTLRYRFATAAPPRPVTCELCGGRMTAGRLFGTRGGAQNVRLEIDIIIFTLSRSLRQLTMPMMDILQNCRAAYMSTTEYFVPNYFALCTVISSCDYATNTVFGISPNIGETGTPGRFQLPVVIRPRRRWVFAGQISFMSTKEQCQRTKMN